MNGSVDSRMSMDALLSLLGGGWDLSRFSAFLACGLPDCNCNTGASWWWESWISDASIAQVMDFPLDQILRESSQGPASRLFLLRPEGELI